MHMRSGHFQMSEFQTISTILLHVFGDITTFSIFFPSGVQQFVNQIFKVHDFNNVFVKQLSCTFRRHFMDASDFAQATVAWKLATLNGASHGWYATSGKSRQ